MLAAVANAERDVLLAHVRNNPSMTLAEFGQILAAPPFRHLGDIKVGEVLGDLITTARTPSGRAASRAALSSLPSQVAAEAARAVSPRRERTKGFRSTEERVDTSSAEARRAYDARVLSAISERKGWVSSEELRPVVGGTAAQLRAALTRLCSNGELTWTGRARGTRYAMSQSA